jgi:hypothetical protein
MSKIILQNLFLRLRSDPVFDHCAAEEEGCVSNLKENEKEIKIRGKLKIGATK